jgi:hypothetical protein
MSATTLSLDLGFRDAEHLRSEYHSFANLINVVHAELQLLERMSGPDAGLRPSIRLCEAATWAFKDKTAAAEHGPALVEWRSRIQADLARVQISAAYEQDGEEARDIIRQVLDDADLRVQEMLARHEIPRPARVQAGATIRSLIHAGADEASRQGSAHGSAADITPDRLRVETSTEAPIPHGLAAGIGRLGAVLLRIPGVDSVDVSVVPEPTTSAPGVIITVSTNPLHSDLLPLHPPSSVDPSRPEEATKSLIALVSYLAGPLAEVVVDPAGSPLVLLRPRQTETQKAD